ncbi:MAG: quinolinate synthase NadA [Muribaculaceae bacterium]|jgi:quinolinate synthase|nr:quinolinate synthase NadA [Muribaculaceae bacterium]MBQ1184296.1 quinolinate synthase NadA [Muribaculaceae bacterium]MBQ2370660.1 quinolinate synthase NadA [Muribaculaceae bacterium]MBQ5697815.1 quinolinate synthase NadA [Muribaculaceae bacterium]MBQ5723330.1 quinolinate synthase NadA [Muribaculaceae bacterium]
MKEAKLTSEELRREIERLKREKNAVIMAHYYQRDEIQEIADQIGDSLALAQLAAQTDADVIVMCGVHFMGETAKILCPQKKVIVPDLKAGCSLANSCDPEEFRKFIEQHPGHTVVSYVNTSAAVKAHTDIVVTSGNAKKIIDSLPKDEKIIFGPDKNLGGYINATTGREMVLWDGACHVHDRFDLEAIVELKKQNPQAKILVHPECRKPLQLIADKVGSTAVLLKFAQEDEAQEFIVVTESGILFEMQRKCPNKRFIPAPAQDAECQCNVCEYMRMNTLEKVYLALRDGQPEIEVDAEIAAKAVRSINRMLELS